MKTMKTKGVDAAREKFRADRAEEKSTKVRRKVNEYEVRIKTLIKERVYALTDKLTGLTKYRVKLEHGANERRASRGMLGMVDEEGFIYKIVKPERIVFIWGSIDGSFCKALPLTIVDPNYLTDKLNLKLSRAVESIVDKDLRELDNKIGMSMNFFGEVINAFRLKANYKIINRLANAERRTVTIEVNLEEIKIDPTKPF